MIDEYGPFLLKDLLLLLGLDPKDWGIPPRGIGGPDTLMTRGEKDGPHTTVRFPESMTGGEKKS